MKGRRSFAFPCLHQSFVVSRFALALFRAASPFPSQSRNLATLGRARCATATRPSGSPRGVLRWPHRRPLASSPFYVPIIAIKSKAKAAPKVARTKSKVEDGIFGTTGRIGFTKQNELFVDRVDMIGFALNLETDIPIYEAEPLLLFFILYTLLSTIGALGDPGSFVDDPPIGIEGAVITPSKGLKSALGLREVGPLFGFTKANELFVGRLAQLGIAFSIIGEIITGKEALAQLNIETGVPISDIEPLVLFNVAFFFIAALNPGTSKFITDV
ncbi:hypothetical protein Taro_027549 [Colocasia esculenta]|uniref:Uncharacterized protein n=1 Tax=Colocasia esculenta TaxID=4460 RepID=A0A843VUL2_COLES|nr:hypothetical protein [Colocasia esculenta]